MGNKWISIFLGLCMFAGGDYVIRILWGVLVMNAINNIRGSIIGCLLVFCSGVYAAGPAGGNGNQINGSGGSADSVTTYDQLRAAPGPSSPSASNVQVINFSPTIAPGGQTGQSCTTNTYSQSCYTAAGSYGIPLSSKAGTASLSADSCTGIVSYLGGCS